VKLPQYVPSQLEKTVRSQDLFSSVAGTMEEDYLLSMETIAATHGASEKTILNIFHHDWAWKRSWQDGCPSC
jgi:hypothetical protein